MEEKPRYVGIDVSKAQVDVAVRPTGQRWAASYDETGVLELVSRMVDLNRSQGEIYIGRAGRSGLGADGRFCCSSPKHGPAAALDFLTSVGQIGEKVAHLLLHRGLGPQTQVGGRLSWRAQPQMASSALQSGLLVGRFTRRRFKPGVAR